MKKSFYLLMVVAMSVCFVAAVLNTSLKTKASSLSWMSPETRVAEYKALRALTESKKPIRSPEHDLTPKEYFDVLARLDRLSEACTRATEEEVGMSATIAHNMGPDIQWMMRDWSTNLQRGNYLVNTPAFEEARSAYEKTPTYPFREKPTDSNPRAAFMWMLFYVSSMFFVAIHYGIRLNDMDCNVWLEMFSNWKFPFWVIFWPIGLFRYPTETSPAEQIARAYRFAILVLSSALSFAAPAMARAQQNGDSGSEDQTHTLHLDVSTLTWPEYLGLNGGVFHPALVEQSSVSVSKGNFYAGVWDSVPLGKKSLSPNFGREVDLFGGWSGKIGPMKADAGFTYVDVTPIGKVRGNVLQSALMLSHDIAVRGGTVSPFLWMRDAQPVKGSSPKKGVFLHGGARYSPDLKGRTSVSASVEAMHDSGAFGFNRAWFAKASADVSYKFAKRWTLNVPVRFSQPLTAIVDGRRTQLTAGCGLSYHR